jgi:hypothetical protein
MKLFSNVKCQKNKAFSSHLKYSITRFGSVFGVSYNKYRSSSRKTYKGIKWRRFRRDLPTYETRGSISSNLSIIEITLKTLEDIDRGVFR